MEETTESYVVIELPPFHAQGYSSVPPEVCPSPTSTKDDDEEIHKDIEKLSCCIKVFFLFIIILTVIHCVISPMQPAHYPTFELDSLSLSNFNIHESRITASWEVGFLRSTRKEPTESWDNKAALLSIFYKDQLLSEVPMPTIYLSSRNTSFTMNVFSLNKRIEDPHAVDAITRDWSESGIVAFTVRLVATSYRAAHYGWDTFDLKGRRLTVTCPDIQVHFSNPSSSQATMFLQHSAKTLTTHDKQAFSSCSTLLGSKQK